MQLQPREKRIVILGAIVATLLLGYLLWPASTPPQTSVDLVPADQRPGTAPQGPGPAAPIPTAPVPTAPVQPGQAGLVPQPVQQVPAAPASPVPEGLKLTGVTGAAAIFSYADGSQRLVMRGREVAPGVVLQGVRLREVILAVGPTNYRLGFGGAAIPIQPPGAPATVPVPSAQPVPTVSVAPPASPRPAPPNPAAGQPAVVMPAPLSNAGPGR